MGVSVAVEIIGDAASATAAIELVAGKLGELANEQGKVNTSSKQAASGLDLLNGAAAKVGVFSAMAAGAVVAADKIYEIGASATRAADSLDMMTGGKADEWMVKMTTATHGLIDDEDAATVATSLLTAGLAKNSDQAAEMTRVATILGASISGIPALQAAHDLEMMLNTANPRGLKEFGVNVEQVKDRIKELQAANKGLSDQQAFNIAFFEQATPLADKLSGVLDDQKAKVDRLKIAWANLGETMAQSAADSLAPAVDGANNLVGGINNVNSAIDQEAERLKAMPGTFEDFRAQLDRFPDIARKLGLDPTGITHPMGTGSYLGDLQVKYKELQAAAADNATSLANSSRRAEELQSANKDLALSFDGLDAGLKDIVTRLNDYNAAVEKQAGLQLAAEQQVGDLTGLWWGSGTATKAAASDIADLTDALSKANEKMTDLQTWGGSDKSFAKTGEEITDLTAKLADANTQVAHGPGANLEKIFEFTTGQLQNMDLTATQFLDKYNELGKLTGQVTDLQIAQGDALRGLNNLYADGEISTATYVNALSQIPAAQDAIAASAIAVRAAVQDATAAAAESGASAASIIQTAIDTAKSARDAAAGVPESATSLVDGVKSALDQINSLPGAQIKLLPDTALQSIDQVAKGIDTLVHTEFDPAVVNADIGPAQKGVAEAQRLLDSIQDKTVTVTVDLVDNTGGGGPAGTTTPQHQSGTPFFEGGLTWVGEGGKELARLPRGTEIYDNATSRNMVQQAAEQAAPGGPTYIISGNIYVTVPTKGGLSDIMDQIAAVRS